MSTCGLLVTLLVTIYNKDTRTACAIASKLAIKTLKPCVKFNK